MNGKDARVLLEASNRRPDQDSFQRCANCGTETRLASGCFICRRNTLAWVEAALDETPEERAARKALDDLIRAAAREQTHQFLDQLLAEMNRRKA